jgi:hypothetical protein
MLDFFTLKKSQDFIATFILGLSNPAAAQRLASTALLTLTLI